MHIALQSSYGVNYMANRLTKIYTRTGDDGTTGLGDGTRSTKDNHRIEVNGDIDELNSFIGVLLTEDIETGIREELEKIQHNLFNLGGDLSIPNHISINETQVTRLENQLDQYNSTLSPLKEFILPGGTRAASLCHVARTVCRRAERSLVRLSKTETVAPIHIKYLNRLSDLLFVLCRILNREQNVKDVLWQPRKNC